MDRKAKGEMDQRSRELQESIDGLRSSELLELGSIYSREDLRSMFSITDSTINTGVFRPKGHMSVWIFVTENKTSDRTQYVDRLEGDVLHWQGQTAGKKDRLIIDSALDGLELLLFYRKRKYEHPRAAFRYEGVFAYEDHWGSEPTSFRLRRVGSAIQRSADRSTPHDVPFRDPSVLALAAAATPAVPDPDLYGRGLQAHRSLERELATWLGGRGLEPRSPASPEIAFDILWRDSGVTFVAEVKSLTPTNEEHQLRLGLGQVLRYRHALRSVGTEAVAVLAVERAPTAAAAWSEVCSEVGVRLVWPGTFSILTAPLICTPWVPGAKGVRLSAGYGPEVDPE